MSYFSHHPEAWDEIEVNGIANKLLSYFEGDEKDDDLRERLKNILAEIQCPNQKYPKDMVLWDALRDWAHDQIGSSEQDYWDSFVR